MISHLVNVCITQPPWQLMIVQKLHFSAVHLNFCFQVALQHGVLLRCAESKPGKRSQCWQHEGIRV